MILDVDVEGGGGWRVINAGTMMNNRRITKGRIRTRWGSKQIKE